MGTSMKIIDKRLNETAEIIDRAFLKVDGENRPEISTGILPHLRHFCEAFMYKVYDEENDADLYQTHENIKIVRSYIKTKYHDVWKFHSLLDASVGHMDFGPMQSEALAIKYIPKLITLKEFLKKQYGLRVLGNIDKYPLDLDKSVTSFYKKILSVLLHSRGEGIRFTRNQYFIQKRSMKYMQGYLFYEYVFDVSDDKANKFNTFVCYSLKNIRFDYDLKLKLTKKHIKFLNTEIVINVIFDYEYSIRPCAFKNLLYLINIDVPDGKRDEAYSMLMETIKRRNISLVDLMENEEETKSLPDGYYTQFLKAIRDHIRRNKSGTNTLRFLLSEMRNSTIRAQQYKSYESMPSYNEEFDGLRIRKGTKAFDLMPFAFFPRRARPSLYSLFELFDSANAADEILYRHIVDHINQNNILFIKPADIGFADERFVELKDKFNWKLEKINPYYNNYRIIEVNGFYTVEAYYEATKKVIARALELCGTHNMEINNDYHDNAILSEEQKRILKSAFTTSSICLVTGTAGTGKTTLIKEFIKSNSQKKILCLTTTNTANNNLKMKGDRNILYRNISQYEAERYHDSFDIVIVDEASFVSTKSINTILESQPNANFLLVGDSEQIQSIEFGNWFDLLLSLLKSKSVVYTLEVGYRTNVNEMKKVWESVRNGDKKDTLELLSAYEMTEKISENIFKVGEGEVVLCLNYDGLYGINNVNRYLQASNPNPSYEYQQNLYKVGDPIIFIINDYSAYGIYNNLKGKIVEIQDNDENIVFKIELSDQIAYFGRLSNEIDIVNEDSKSYAIVEKMKYYNDKYDSDMDTRTKLPFQISYAMSIHKAQGLEFDSVKIVITKEAEERISKNIFYTAITRAKKKLKIYWEPEVANEVLNNIENSGHSKTADLSIIKQEFADRL